jgi:tetratricopeptide (TPR) repeat protein
VTLLEQPATPPAPARAASAVNALAEVLVARGSFEAGEQQFRRALALAREQAGADGTLAASILINLGRLLEQLRRFDDAERVLQEAMTASGDPSMAMHAQAELAGLAADRGDLARAADMYRPRRRPCDRAVRSRARGGSVVPVGTRSGPAAVRARRRGGAAAATRGADPPDAHA